MSSSPRSDKDLYLLLQTEDEAAFAELYKRYYNRLFLLILKLTHDRTVTKDILQELFAKLWVSRDVIEVTDNVVGFLSRMARNMAIDYLRRQRPLESADVLEDTLEYHVLQAEIQQGAALTNELRTAIRECLETLRKENENYYYAIVLAWSHRMTDAQIAEKFDTTKDTVAQWRRRGRLKVMKCIVAKSEQRGFDLPEISYPK